MRKPIFVNILKNLNACMGQEVAMKEGIVNMDILACVYIFKQEDAKKEIIAIIIMPKIDKTETIQMRPLWQEIFVQEKVHQVSRLF